MEINQTSCLHCLPPDTDVRYLELRDCFRHAEKAVGSEDAQVSLIASELQFSGTGDSDPETQRAWSSWMRSNRQRKQKLRKGQAKRRK